MLIRNAVAPAILVLGLSATANAEAYHVTLCPDPVDCFIAPNPDAPADFPDITPQLDDFFAFAEPRLPLAYTVTGGGGDGFVFGHVSEPDGWIDGQWIWHDGHILCCTTDWPYRVTSVNSSNVWIGQRSDFGPWVGSEITRFGVTPFLIELDADSQALFGNTLNDWNTQVIAIDDAGRISGSSWLGPFLLEPINTTEASAETSTVASVAVPEPAAGALLAGALALFFGRNVWRRKKRSGEQ